MPRVKDLGINVIPETMRPPEIGGGGGCGCTNFTNCIGCTKDLTFCACTNLSLCEGCTRVTNPCIGCTQNPTIVDCANPSVCGCTRVTNPCIGCTDSPTVCACTNLSLCNGCTHFTNPCIGCTDSPTVCACTNLSLCNGCTRHTNPCIGTTQLPCGCSALGSQCTAGTHTITITPTTPQIFQSGGLTREHIAALRDQLRQSLSALDEAEKNIGPQTVEAIDQREQEIKAELEQLSARRAELGKKKS
ncbi:MAG TPA: hypothetical protein VEK11_20155 [Thermoanaerobaculia bacterium]|jgi:hypothetical protein|nr:hypothetical protein [Thermoanaerobaculia bacterium]